CCDTQWDDICAQQAAQDCNASCGCSGGGTPGGGGGACCAASDGAGCNISACQNCVCSLDSFCCDTQWDDICAQQAAQDCNASCGCSGGGTPGGGTTGGTCCAASDGAGCNVSACQSCVCSLDSFCCDTQWDDICAQQAAQDCNASCKCTTTGGTGTTVKGCCTAQSSPGCTTSSTCQNCVCAQDSFCCSTSWDDLCAGAAANQCKSSCGC
ncbi:MAG: hypothetical protein HUU55_10415, partial [Myxococcales bacterium]|nr:hypothetical protein [Myxococcales bacterium]